ncbi:MULTISPECIES: 7-carboxy-7-deazaguanine synthase QueE [Helicobacter]|uniref:7-carboxy-7-deazaguanine synthase QueE n=1 Tax=Helicobacter TaxID=209 RepID=UPI000EB13445|nr:MULTISPECIES: 7-carboxy-7-deazaguanine synthase QueE [Helicobacter]
MKLPLVEAFYSLQGEGAHVGTPSIFVRLGGCNLRCRGFGVVSFKQGRKIVGCDSAYAVHPMYARQWRALQTSQALLDTIDALTPPTPNLPHIVLTGGEPTLHFNNPLLLDALEKLLARGYFISVESNGSVDFEFYPCLQALHFSLSVKLSFSLESASKRLNYPILRAILSHARAVFKFVVRPEALDQDLAEIDSILEDLACAPPPIYLMPLGTHGIEMHAKALAPVCLQRGYRLSDRLHIRLWGDVRGR